ncbi:MAG: hypothetical protein RLZZ450_6758 [Pseudomonadota bacterium]|jgi:hypothetical protein
MKSSALPQRWLSHLSSLARARPRVDRFAAIVSLLHFALLVYFSQFHELWRDEVRALNIVLDSGSPLDLMRNLHNEGHPILWYAILYVGYGILRTKTVLVAASLLIAEAAVYVFAAYSPFPRWQRVLFAIGLFPLYEYSVMCRNYGLAMLLGFVFCALYPRRFERPIWFGFVIALFANATAFCAVIAAGTTSLWLIERVYVELRQPRDALPPIAQPRARVARTGLGLALALLGIGLSVYVFRADSTSLFYRPQNITLDGTLAAWYAHLERPAVQLVDLFSLSGPLPLTVAVWLLTAYFLLRNPIIGLLFYGSIVSFDLFSALIYAPAVRHKGLVYIVIVAVFWLDAQLPARELPRYVRAFCRALAPVVAVLVPVLFAVQAHAAYDALKLDRARLMSGAKWLAHIIEANPAYADAIVVGEPDLRIEALSYYVDNPIYQARDHRFGRKVNFSQGSASNISLDQLLSLARALAAREHKPVIVVLGPDLNPNGPFVSVHTFVKVFHYDPESLARFRAATRKIAVIRQNIAQIVDPEEFDVYVLR